MMQANIDTLLKGINLNNFHYLGPFAFGNLSIYCVRKYTHVALPRLFSLFLLVIIPTSGVHFMPYVLFVSPLRVFMCVFPFVPCIHVNPLSSPYCTLALCLSPVFYVYTVSV